VEIKISHEHKTAFRVLLKEKELKTNKQKPPSTVYSFHKHLVKGHNVAVLGVMDRSNSK
jgi:hypothetical protein